MNIFDKASNISLSDRKKALARKVVPKFISMVRNTPDTIKVSVGRNPDTITGFADERDLKYEKDYNTWDLFIFMDRLLIEDEPANSLEENVGYMFLNMVLENFDLGGCHIRLDFWQRNTHHLESGEEWSDWNFTLKKLL